jgi:FKBP-type peptidyl-prolyl cis-trans isomerase
MFRLLIASAISAFLFSAQIGQAQETPGFDTIKERHSYFIGWMLGDQLQNNELDIYDIEFEALLAGIEDRFDRVQPRLTPDEELAVKKHRDNQVLWGKRPPAASNSLEAGRAFLERNGARPGIVTTASGLQYRVERPGTGPRPRGSQLVTVEFVGRLLDGTIFESTNETGQAVTFRVNEVIPGWEEVLKLMNTGSHYSVWIPSELAYRNQGSGDKIRPNEVLHFEMNLASIE